MTSHEQQDEADQYPVTLEPELKDAIAVLSKKLVELHILWQQYRQLYGEDAETIKLLNRTAGLFFKIVQNELWDSVLLGVCRMTDPAEQGGRHKKKNLTIQSLLPLITDEQFKVKVELACKKAVDAAEFARDHRNKRIAHQDHNYTTNRTLNPLGGVSRAAVESMLKAIRDVMKLVEAHYNGHDVLYEKFVDYSGARSLVSKLRQLERSTPLQE